MKQNLDQLGVLLKKLEETELVRALSLSDAEINDALDRRDSELFSSSWMAAQSDVEAGKPIPCGAVDATLRVESLRRAAYLQAYDQWKSSDLAGYISDDFGLIGDAVANSVNNRWINGLFLAYLSGVFPCDRLTETFQSLADLIARWDDRNANSARAAK